MEITADFDPGAIERHLDKIEREMEELRAELPVAFADWQSDDMNRAKPRTKTLDVERPTSNFVRASTFIMPTSRYRVKKRRRVIRRLKKTGQHERVVKSNRPILRADLIRDFQERFIRLLHGAF
jgi:hypothetical protein